MAGRRARRPLTGRGFFANLRNLTLDSLNEGRVPLLPMQTPNFTAGFYFWFYFWFSRASGIGRGAR
jgi:hypothetical protein